MTKILSNEATYTEDNIEAKYSYSRNEVFNNSGILNVKKITEDLIIKTQRKLPKTGLMMIGLGGNNGTTVIAGIIANKNKLKWKTRFGIKKSNWYGSLLLSSTLKLGVDVKTGEDCYVSLNSMLPMLNPEDLIIGGWDINNLPLGDAMRRAQVLDINVQDQIYNEMQSIIPLPGIYLDNFIAINQNDRANNILSGSLFDMLQEIRKNIRDFKIKNNLEKVIIVWTASTERFSDIIAGVNDTAENFLEAIKKNNKEIAPSALYAAAAILEGCGFINGSPQNTLLPGLQELAKNENTFIAGDDLKSGQTKLKSVLVDFLVSAGIKPTSIVSYNHLGNNDGRNLSSQEQFRSKEISKSTVVDDMVKCNTILYSKPNEKPDHCVVIKYVPAAGDSKRALDEYSSEIFMGGSNTIVINNTCEDSLLAAPIIVDLVLLMELCQRITFRRYGQDNNTQFQSFHPVLSMLSYLCKAPLVPKGTPIVNALTSQRDCIINVLRACLGLGPESNMMLEHKVPFLMRESQ